MHPTVSCCNCVATDAFFIQAVSQSLLAAVNTLFVYFLHCFRDQETLQIYIPCSVTQGVHIYQKKKKKSLQKIRDCLVTFMQIKGAEFYINYTSIQG